MKLKTFNLMDNFETAPGDGGGSNPAPHSLGARRRLLESRGGTIESGVSIWSLSRNYISQPRRTDDLLLGDMAATATPAGFIYPPASAMPGAKLPRTMQVSRGPR